MSEWPGSEAFAAEIHAAFASPITYTPPSGAPQQITGVYSDVPAPTWDGKGASLRTISWEVQQSDVADPALGAEIVAGAKSWRVVDITRRDDVEAWELIVERAS